MVIEFLQPHALNLGEDFEFVSAFKSRSNQGVEDYRLLLKGVNTGTQILLGMHEQDGPDHPHFVLFTIDNFIFVSTTNIKQQQYSYHWFSNDITKVKDFFNLWRNSDPMVHLGNYRHSFISKIPNYQGSYRFNGIIY